MVVRVTANGRESGMKTGKQIDRDTEAHSSEKTIMNVSISRANSGRVTNSQICVDALAEQKMVTEPEIHFLIRQCRDRQLRRVKSCP